MSFKQKTWNDRISEYPTRRTLTDVSDNTTKTVNVAREEGTISQEGDAFSAANMNDLEGRIADGFSTLSQDSLKMSSSNPSSDSIKFGINASGQYGYIKQGASEVTPFRNPTGNANPSDVLSGKTFSTASLENARGTMPNRGGHQSSTGVGGGSGSLWAYMPYGYYDNYNNSGNAWIDITDEQAKTLANNAGVGYNSGYANGYDSGMQVRTGLLAISSSGQTSSASGTLAPGTYDWYVRSNVEHWTAYKIEADGKVYAEANVYKGDAQNWLGGTFTINHKFNASVYAYAYGSGTHCVAINRR